MLRRPIKEINAEFSAEEKYLDSIQRTVRESCIAAGLSVRDTSAILLATEEGATNIIRHAYLYEKGLIRLRIVIYPRRMVFSLIDFGRSFQPDARGAVDLERLVASGRKGGLGFYMIQKIMDDVQYISSADRNELRMIKEIGASTLGLQPMLGRMFGLRVKFSFWTFFIVFIIVGAAFYFMDRQTTHQMFARLDRTVLALMKTVADQATNYMIRSRSDVEFDELVVSYTRANRELRRLIITERSGRVRAHSDDARNIGKMYLPPEAISIELLEQPQRYEAGGEKLNYLIVPITSGQRVLGYAHAVYTSDVISGPLAEARRRILILTSLLLLFGVVGIYMLSNYFVRPIVNITRRVRRFASGDLESELPLEGAEEFFEISKAFNEIMTRLSQDRKNIAAREKMTREIEVASQIQRTLLPSKLPEIPHLQLDAFYRAASVVGGDLYDVFAVGRDRYCLVVADVSGKGVPASLVMSMLRTVIQIHSQGAQSPREIIIRVDDYLRRNMPAGMFITVMLVLYDSSDRHLDVASAGHNAMLYYQHESAKTLQINPAGMPLGVPASEEGAFERSLKEVRIDLHEGDHFLIFTDGVTEAADREGRRYGLMRLEELFTTLAGSDDRRPISNLSAGLVARLDDFTGFAKSTDDITFLMARFETGVTPPAEPSPDSVATIVTRDVRDDPPPSREG